MTISVDKLRAKYPNPVPTPTDGQPPPAESYCVGGALALEMGFSAEWGVGTAPGASDGRCGFDRERHPDYPEGSSVSGTNGFVGQKIGMFPSPRVLEMVLMNANPGLSAADAQRFAELITEKNDTGNFETAWMHLADALGYSAGDWTPADDAAVARFLTGAIS